MEIFSAIWVESCPSSSSSSEVVASGSSFCGSAAAPSAADGRAEVDEALAFSLAVAAALVKAPTARAAVSKLSTLLSPANRTFFFAATSDARFLVSSRPVKMSSRTFCERLKRLSQRRFWLGARGASSRSGLRHLNDTRMSWKLMYTSRHFDPYAFSSSAMRAQIPFRPNWLPATVSRSPRLRSKKPVSGTVGIWTVVLSVEAI
mmetsp:Transcript_7596/g.18324  ORF Transcript_7596/g.18324 Transcript_7596/m.18324 type:complete len:204 (-) Transcript_7596:2462-3073(-)